ncbi:MAG: dTDP-4-dehydrorhamnose 3,5-epimerase [Flavobacteriaceae bacterium]|nr:dTDP-4-dehydrorhamnose 3,5-epimerase [Flavobacteriaceae bacterium]|tara:strand:+ start:5125 stop:5661 length:537 start_codon:yes stop_codon:yes gene_type:complete
MKLINTDIKNLIIIKHNVYNDNRGYFKEKFKKEKFQEQTNIKVNFCQDNSVKSHLNVLRGLHFQKEPFAQSKLVSVSLGSILDVVVDIRKDSATYGKYFSYILSCENHESLFIPKGFAHGYLTLTDFAIINYQVDNYYNPGSEGLIPYNDKFLNIDWGIQDDKIIISNKDSIQNTFEW